MSEVKKRTLTQKANALTKIQEEYTPILRTLQEGSQCYNVLKFILTRGSITAKDAVDNFGIYRLSARIADLRGKGVPIKTELVPTKSGLSTTKYARYSITTEDTE